MPMFIKRSTKVIGDKTSSMCTRQISAPRSTARPHELETNELLKQDYGTFTFRDVNDPVPDPTFESEEEWQARNLLRSNDVRILDTGS